MNAIMRFFPIILLSGLVPTLSACDPEHKTKCEWFLIPDERRKEDATIGEGMIPVCARNLVVKKEDCRLQAKLEFAKDLYGKKFIYNDMKTENLAVPRTISDVKVCE